MLNPAVCVASISQFGHCGQEQYTVFTRMLLRSRSMLKDPVMAIPAERLTFVGREDSDGVFAKEAVKFTTAPPFLLCICGMVAFE